MTAIPHKADPPVRVAAAPRKAIVEAGAVVAGVLTGLIGVVTLARVTLVRASDVSVLIPAVVAGVDEEGKSFEISE